MRALATLACAAALAACTQGTTPDCAQVNCGPNLDGSSVLDTGTPSDGATDASDGGADAATDAPADAPADGPKDATAG